MIKQVTVSVSIQWIDGWKTFSYPLSEFKANEARLDEYVLHGLGVAVDVYHEWLQMDGRIRCSAQTGSGSRCKHTVSGKRYQMPAEWDAANRVGGYCKLHGGE